MPVTPRSPAKADTAKPSEPILASSAAAADREGWLGPDGVYSLARSPRLLLSSRCVRAGTLQPAGPVLVQRAVLRQAFRQTVGHLHRRARAASACSSRAQLQSALPAWDQASLRRSR